LLSFLTDEPNTILLVVNFTSIRRQLTKVKSSSAISQIVPSFGGTQFLRHEIMLVPDRMIFKGTKYAVPDLFIKRFCLKTEGVEECIGATAFDRIHALARLSPRISSSTFSAPSESLVRIFHGGVKNAG
jgi:hypothetical protein